MRNVCSLDAHKIEEKFSVLTPELDRLRDFPQLYHK